MTRLPLYLLMGTNRLKMVAKKSIRGSGYPFFTLGSAVRPLYLLMDIDSAKVCAFPKTFFPAGHGLAVPHVPAGNKLSRQIS